MLGACVGLSLEKLYMEDPMFFVILFVDVGLVSLLFLGPIL